MIGKWQNLIGLFFVLPGIAQGSDESRPLPEVSQIQLSSPKEDWGGRDRLSGEWWLGAGLDAFEDRNRDDGVVSTFKAVTKGNYRLTSAAELVFRADAKFSMGRAQDTFSDNKMGSELRVREGFVRWSHPNFEMAMGALSQNFLRSELLVSGRKAFPGLKQTLRFTGDKLQAAAFAQQSVPTSYSLNSERAEREPLPTFLTETLELKITPAKELSAELFATHFRYNNLPAVVAFESATLGNTVTGDIAPNTSFRYGFDGFVLGTEACWCLEGPLRFRFNGEWLQNSAAPQGVNRGQFLRLSADVRLSEIEITPQYGVFFTESDAAVGYYNRPELGNTNRRGDFAAVEFAFLKYGFNVEIEYERASPINANPYQFDRQTFFIGVETKHVSF